MYQPFSIPTLILSIYSDTKEIQLVLALLNQKPLFGGLDGLNWILMNIDIKLHW